MMFRAPEIFRIDHSSRLSVISTLQPIRIITIDITAFTNSDNYPLHSRHSIYNNHYHGDNALPHYSRSGAPILHTVRRPLRRPHNITCRHLLDISIPLGHTSRAPATRVPSSAQRTLGRRQRVIPRQSRQLLSLDRNGARDVRCAGAILPPTIHHLLSLRKRTHFASLSRRTRFTEISNRGGEVHCV